MIFYFSGTGNSQAVAEKIAQVQQEDLISMVDAKRRDRYELREDEQLIFVFPIYAWRPPQIVIDFIEKIEFAHYQHQPITIIATCGENIGDTVALLKKVLHKKKMVLSNAYSLIMPNNYLIHGTVDSQDEVKRKLQQVDRELEKINTQLSNQISGVIEIKKGPLPSLLTYVAGEGFNRFVRKTDPFFANDHCITCKVCEKICPTGCITVDKKPAWQGECIQCLACLHYCPKSAIQYGKKMAQKARYTHPLVAWYELNQTKKSKD